MSEKSCKNCLYSDYNSEIDINIYPQKTVTLCKRFPPIPMITEELFYISIFPPIMDDSIKCGEWKHYDS